MRHKNLERNLLYREHFFTLSVIGLEFINAISNWI